MIIQDETNICQILCLPHNIILNLLSGLMFLTFCNDSIHIAHLCAKHK